MVVMAQFFSRQLGRTRLTDCFDPGRALRQLASCLGVNRTVCDLRLPHAFHPDSYASATTAG